MRQSFNPTAEQAAIIYQTEGCFLVVAPPGSGKTEVLTQRILCLLNSTESTQSRILALTFTTKAAENMRARIQAQAGEAVHRVRASTFHAFALDVLQHYGDAIGVSAQATIYESEDDRLEALNRGLKDDGFTLARSDEGQRQLRRLLAEIGKHKRNLVAPESVDSSPEGLTVPLQDAYLAYNRTLRLYNAVDFDDLLGLCVRLFVENEKVAHHYRRMFRYILVDEAQDTSRAQYEMLRTLCGETHRNVMMVADGDQAIYRFAGASDKYLRLFRRDFNAITLPLTRNFRCALVIVRAANLLIQNNPSRLSSQIVEETLDMATGCIFSVSLPDESAEGAHILRAVQKLLTDGLKREWLYADEATTLSPEDVCVLGRSRYLMEPTLRAFEDAGVPHQVGVGESGLFESSEFRFLYHGLRLLTNPHDVISRANMLGQCPPDVRAGVDEESGHPSTLLTRLHQAPGSIGVFAQVLSTVNVREIDTDRLVKRICEEVARESTTDENLLTLDSEVWKQRWLAYARRTDRDERNLKGFLGEIALTSRATVDGPGVRVLTVHAAKGLEFRAVVILGFNEGCFPDFRSASTPDGIVDERRNAYVAITRAARFLYLTRPRLRNTRYGPRQQTPSRFIAEMGLQEKQSK